MRNTRGILLVVILTIAAVAEIILSILLYNDYGNAVVRNIGWVVLWISAAFGWLPVYTLRKAGNVPEGKVYMHTTILVDRGVYAIVRHPQYLAGMLLGIALAMIAQHWIVALLGAVVVLITYLDTFEEEMACREKFGEEYERYTERVPRVNFVLGIARILQGNSKMRSATLWYKVAFTLLILLGVALRVVGVMHSSPSSMVNMPLPDDAFYYFTLARNVASGEGFVISGDGLPTTGFQPLWGFILSAAGWFLIDAPPTHLVLVSQILGALIGIATALLIFDLTARLAQDDLVAFFAFGAFLLSPQIIKHNLNGMETSLTFFALLLLLKIFLDFKLHRARPRRAFIIGLVCGFGFLARVDLSLFIAAALIISAISIKPWPDRGAMGGFFLRMALFGAGFLVAVAPWIWLGFTTGLGIIPESGEAVRNLTLLVRQMPLLGFLESIQDAPDIFLPHYFQNAVGFTSAWMRQVPLLLPLTIPLFAVFSNDEAIGLTGILAIVVLLVAYALSMRRTNAALKRAFRMWLTYLLLMTLAYTFYIQVPWFHQRYAAPIGVVFSLIILAIFIPPLLSLRFGKWLMSAAAAAVAFGFVLLVLRGSYTWILQGEKAVPEDGFYQASEIISQSLPPEVRVGAFSAGLIGYYARQPVIPLDGKVNQNAKRALEEGRMFAYICQAEIKYIADWEKMVSSLLALRSQAWSENNLDLVRVVEVEAYNDIMIYQVDDDACNAILAD